MKERALLLAAVLLSLIGSISSIAGNIVATQLSEDSSFDRFEWLGLPVYLITSIAGTLLIVWQVWLQNQTDALPAGQRIPAHTAASGRLRRGAIFFLFFISIPVPIVYGLAASNLGDVLLALLATSAYGVLVTLAWAFFEFTPLLEGQRYRRTYFQFLETKIKYQKIRGLNIRHYQLLLRDVFVELRLDPSLNDASDQKVQNNVLRPERVGGERLQIWNLLSPKTPRNFVLIGVPGSGKSTLLENIALLLLVPVRKRRTITRLKQLPLLHSIRSLGRSIIQRPEMTLVQACEEQLATAQYPAPPPGWFEQQLATGGCLVLLDGLDEISTLSERIVVTEWVLRQMGAYPQSSFIITSRPPGYQPDLLPGVALLQICPFSDGQREAFVRQWYRATEIAAAGYHRRVLAFAEQRADDLLARLDMLPGLDDLSHNPLLLTLIATVHRYLPQLPHTRGELYERMFEIILDSRVKEIGLPVKLQLLSGLAITMMNRRKAILANDEIAALLSRPLTVVRFPVAADEFAPFIDTTTGLLVAPEEGEYGFSHMTFQEYLAARHLAAKTKKDKRYGAQLTSFVHDPWWRETIKLYAAQADAAPLIAACVDQPDPPTEALILAAEIVDEARKPDPALQERVEQVLLQSLVSPIAERRSEVAQALLHIRLRRLRAVNPHLQVDERPITMAEYQLFLDEMEREQLLFHPDHWLGANPAADQVQQSIVGVRPQDALAFCAWLNRREEGGWQYRIPARGEIATLGDIGWDVGALTPTSYWVRTEDGFDVEAAPPGYTSSVSRQLILTLTQDRQLLQKRTDERSTKLRQSTPQDFERRLNDERKRLEREIDDAKEAAMRANLDGSRQTNSRRWSGSPSQPVDYTTLDYTTEQKRSPELRTNLIGCIIPSILTVTGGFFIATWVFTGVMQWLQQGLGWQVSQIVVAAAVLYILWVIGCYFIYNTLSPQTWTPLATILFFLVLPIILPLCIIAALVMVVVAVPVFIVGIVVNYFFDVQWPRLFRNDTNPLVRLRAWIILKTTGQSPELRAQIAELRQRSKNRQAAIKRDRAEALAMIRKQKNEETRSPIGKVVTVLTTIGDGAFAAAWRLALARVTALEYERASRFVTEGANQDTSLAATIEQVAGIVGLEGYANFPVDRRRALSTSPQDLQTLRSNLLIRAAASVYELQRQRWFVGRRHSGFAEQYLRHCVELYILLAIVDERSNGRVAAIEGIRLVRERHRASPSLSDHGFAQGKHWWFTRAMHKFSRLWAVRS